MRILLLAVSLASLVYGLPSVWQPCSKGCSQGIATEGETESEKLPSQDLNTSSCSCSPSCSVYSDCCHNSPYKTTVDHLKLTLDCLPISGKGSFLSVGSCPSSWDGSSEFCEEGLGNLPPVTSRDTGTTYDNIYCAVCNGDGNNVKTWNVQLKCCPAATSNSNIHSREQYVFHKDLLWRLLVDKNNSRTFCQCKFFLNRGEEGLIEKLELRRCGRRSEISKCSVSWDDEEVDESCVAYTDPVYVGEKVYRNSHCAACNYERTSSLSCVPSVMEELSRRGLTPSQIQEYCKKNNLATCVHFISTAKGKAYAFSKLFSMSQQGCVPPAGQRCCANEQYDFAHKRCRKIKN